MFIKICLHLSYRHETHKHRAEGLTSNPHNKTGQKIRHDTLTTNTGQKVRHETLTTNTGQKVRQESQHT